MANGVKRWYTNPGGRPDAPHDLQEINVTEAEALAHMGASLSHLVQRHRPWEKSPIPCNHAHPFQPKRPHSFVTCSGR